MIDEPARRVKIETPLGPFETTLEPEATVAGLIEHVVSEKPLRRGDIFEIAINGQVIPSETGLDRLPAGEIELIATGGVV